MTRPHSVQVVVAFDFTPSAEEALQRAIDVASRAPHHVLHVVTALDPHPRTLFSELRPVSRESADQTQARVLERVKSAFSGRDNAAVVEVFAHARIGKPADQVLGVASDVGADLIFIGSHGSTGIDRALLGSVSEQVVREARCPVMVVRPKTYAEVELLHMVKSDHPRAMYHPPHRYQQPARLTDLHADDEWPRS